MSKRVVRSLFSLSWQSFAYGLGILGQQMAVYLSLPLFTNSMPQEEFAAVSVMAALFSFTNTLSNAGLPAAVFRLYNDAHDEKERCLILGSAQVLMIIYTLMIVLVMLVGAVPLSQWQLGDTAYASMVRIVATLLFVQAFNYYGNILLRLQVRPLVSSLQSLFQIVVQLGLALVLVRGYNLGAYGYWLGYLIGAVMGLLLMLQLVRDALVFRVSSRHMKRMVVYSLPLLPSTLALWALRLADRSLITSLAGLKEVAIYEVGCKIGKLVALAIAPFKVAWPQFAFSAMHNSNAPAVYRNSLTYVMAGCVFMTIGVITFRADLVQVMAPSTYASAMSVIPWIALSQVAWGVYPILSISLKIAKRTFHIAAVTISAALMNILVNVLVIPVMGIQGAAIANLVGYVVLVGGVYIMGQRFYPFPIDKVRLGQLTLIGGLTVILVIQLDQLSLSLWCGRLLRIVALLLFPALLLLTGFVTRDQCQTLWQTTANLLQKRLGWTQPEEI